LRSKFCTA